MVGQHYVPLITHRFTSLCFRFKLHLGPDNMNSNAELESIGSNRSFVGGKTAIDIYTDFLRYLFDCARQFIIETYSERLWNSVEDRIEIILSHPNGWGGLQQSKLRDAAVHAGLVPDTTTGRQRVHFVSEGEASLHYCINNGLPPQALQVRYGLSYLIFASSR